MMADAGFCSGCLDISAGRPEEVHRGLVFERRRVGQVDQNVRPGERFCEALSSYRVDTRPGRRSDCFMPRLAELLYNLRTDQPGTSNYDDLHWLVFQIGRASCRERVCQYV